MMSIRREFMDELEESFIKEKKPEERIFALHPNEDRIVLSHATFWIMSKPLERALKDNKILLLLRQYEEEMLNAYLTESDEYSDLLKYCNLLFDALPMSLNSYLHVSDKRVGIAKRLVATSIITAGFVGDMQENLANELLDDMDFHYNKLFFHKIELLVPELNKIVENECSYLYH